MSELIMYAGFALATYSVIGNDVVQTLGTFLTSNSKRPWYVLWLFAAGILCITLFYSWYVYDGDPTFDRLVGVKDGYSLDNPSYPPIEDMPWWYLIPPLTLMFITRSGLPVSTTFLILTFFKPKGLIDMIVKSVLGYGVAFVASVVIYMAISPTL